MNIPKPIAAFITDTHLKDSNHSLVEDIFDQAIKQTLELGLTELFHGGDFFDSRKAQTVDNFKCFLRILEKFKANGIKFKIVVGNHDKADNDAKDSFLDSAAYSPFLVEGKERFMTLYDLPGSYEYNKVMFHFCPFFNHKTYISVLNDYCKKTTFDSTKKHVLVTHTEFSQSINNDGLKIEHGIEKDVFKQFDLVLSGHFHDYQEFFNRKAFYIGSGYQANFGENTKKGLTVLYEDLSLKQVKLNFPEYINYNIPAKDISSELIEQLRLEKTQTGSFIKVKITGKKEEVDAVNRQELLVVGIKVEKKADALKKEDIIHQVEKLDTTTIKDLFPIFCKDRGLEDETELGLQYLTRAKVI